VRNALVMSLALALAACSGPLLGGEVQEAKLCVKRPATQIQGLCRTAAQLPGAALLGIDCSKDVATLLAQPAAQAILASVPHDAEDSGTIPLGDHIPALDKKGTTGSIKLLSFAVSGTEDTLKNLDSFQLELSTPGSAPFATFSYVKADGTSYLCDQATPKTCTMTVQIDGQSDANDLFKHLNDGDISYHVALKGNAQALAGLWSDWQASIESCMSASLTVDAIELLKNK
jgi:hypothetical protein